MAPKRHTEMLLVVGWVCVFMSLFSSLILIPDAWAGMVLFGVIAAILSLLQIKWKNPRWGESILMLILGSGAAAMGLIGEIL